MTLGTLTALASEMAAAGAAPASGLLASLLLGNCREGALPSQCRLSVTLLVRLSPASVGVGWAVFAVRHSLQTVSTRRATIVSVSAEWVGQQVPCWWDDGAGSENTRLPLPLSSDCVRGTGLSPGGFGGAAYGSW